MPTAVCVTGGPTLRSRWLLSQFNLPPGAVYPHSITYKVCKIFPTNSIKAYGGVEMFISLFFTSVLNRYKYLASRSVVNESSMWLGGPQRWSGRFGKHEKRRAIIAIGLLDAISPTTQNCMCEERNSMLNSRNVCHHLV